MERDREEIITNAIAIAIAISALFFTVSVQYRRHFYEELKPCIFCREKNQNTPDSSPIYQNAPRKSKITKLPLRPKKYTL